METTQTVNLEELEEKFGTNLAEKIKAKISYCEENKELYKVEVVEESKYFPEIAFVTKAYSYIYQVSLTRKSITSENFIGWGACKKIAKLMENF